MENDTGGDTDMPDAHPNNPPPVDPGPTGSGKPAESLGRELTSLSILHETPACVQKFRQAKVAYEVQNPELHGSCHTARIRIIFTVHQMPCKDVRHDCFVGLAPESIAT